MYRNRGFDFGAGRIATGRQQAERAIRLVPDSPEALYAVSLAQRYTGSPEASAASLEQVLAKNPQHARALLALGVNYLLRERTEEALALFERARQQPKWAPLADYQDYLRCMHTRHFAEAERAIRRSRDAALSVNSVAGVALVALTWRGDYARIAQDLEALPPALRNAPRVVWALAQLAFFRRDPDAALRALDRLPDDFIQDSWYTGPKAQLVGQAHALAGRAAAARLAWEEALGVIDARLRSAPGDAAYHLSRGEILARLGRTAEALAEAKTVEEISRGPVPDWALSEVRIYALLGQADRALPLIERHLAALRNWPLTPTLLKFDPLWDALRGDPRFDALASAPTPDAPPAR
jgi:tetratricopeptide (TPR) repeat protein